MTGKGGRCVVLTTLPPSWDNCLEIWDPHSHGTLRAFPGVALLRSLIWGNLNNKGYNKVMMTTIIV
jgi:hypothetical protein